MGHGRSVRTASRHLRPSADRPHHPEGTTRGPAHGCATRPERRSRTRARPHRRPLPADAIVPAANAARWRRTQVAVGWRRRTRRAASTLRVRFFSSSQDAPRSRRPTDAILFGLSALVLSALATLGSPLGLREAVTAFLRALPGLLGWFWEACRAGVALWAITLIAVFAGASGRRRVLRDRVISLAIATLGAWLLARPADRGQHTREPALGHPSDPGWDRRDGGRDQRRSRRERRARGFGGVGDAHLPPGDLLPPPDLGELRAAGAAGAWVRLGPHAPPANASTRLPASSRSESDVPSISKAAAVCMACRKTWACASTSGSHAMRVPAS